MVDGVSLAHFRLSEGHLLLSLVLFDETNRPIFRVADNELIYSIDTWDIELIGRSLLIRQAARDILADIRFDPEAGRVTVSRGRFLLNGVEILITPDYALVVNNRLQFSRTSMVNCAFGLVLGEMQQEVGCAIRVQGIPRYLGDRAAAKQWADANTAQP
jgi:hypothetical protein